jgi:hypothetical protein
MPNAFPGMGAAGIVFAMRDSWATALNAGGKVGKREMGDYLCTIYLKLPIPSKLPGRADNVPSECPMPAGWAKVIFVRLQLWLCRGWPNMRTFVYLFIIVQSIGLFFLFIAIVQRTKEAEALLIGRGMAIIQRTAKANEPGKQVIFGKGELADKFIQLVVQPHQIVVDIEYDCQTGRNNSEN